MNFHICAYSRSQHCVTAYKLLLYPHPTSKQTWPLASIYIYRHPDIPWWASLLTYRLNVLCSTLSWRRSSLFFSLSQSWHPIRLWQADCVRFLTVKIGQLTNKSVVSENTDIDCNANKQYPQDKNGLNGSVSESYGLLTPSIKHWSTSGKAIHMHRCWYQRYKASI